MGVDARLFVRVSPAMSKRAVLRLAFEAGEGFGHGKFFIDRDGKYGKPQHAISPVKVYRQDGDDIYPKSGEQFLYVHLWGRYYGEGYERGDLPFYLALAEWLEIKTGGEVWYGGDSSGICAKPFNRFARRKLMRHFAEHGHRPYHSGFLRSATPRRCEFCDEDMPQFGSSGDGHYTSFTCLGCGFKEETRDHGATWGQPAAEQS